MRDGSYDNRAWRIPLALNESPVDAVHWVRMNTKDIKDEGEVDLL